MSFPQYESYKDSGIEWLGQVPGHWEVKLLKFICRFAYGDSLTSEIREDGEFAVYGSNGQVGIHTSSNTRAPVIVIGRKGSFGKVNYSDKPVFSIDTTYFIDDRFTNQSIEWLKYSLLPLKLDEYSKDSAVPGLAREDAYTKKLPLPSLSEQQTIATFLDFETAQIDALIAEQQKLIALLKEKRQAVISHAVTKGLDTTVPMKDSGIEWLGEVPELWEVTTFRRILKKLEQGWSPQSEDRESQEHEWAVIKLSAVKKGFFYQTEHKVIPEEAIIPEEFEIQSGDLLLTRGNTPELVGDVCFVRETRTRLLMSDLVYRLVVNLKTAFPLYLAYWLLSDAGRCQIVSDARGSSSSMVKISQGHILNWVCFLPPKQEQSTIAAYLDSETTKIDELIAEAQRGIELLKERRSALISAAVTGKIDVRGWTPPEAV